MRNILFILFGVAAAVCLLLYFFQGEKLLTLILRLLQATLANGEQLRQAILEYGPLAPFIFTLVQILQVVFAPIPGEATGAVGGYLFGAGPGFIYSSIALTIGSGLAFSIGHLFKDALQHRYQTTKAYRTFNHLVCKGDFVIPFVLFLLPGFPKDILSYLLGMSSMPFRVFLFVAGVARMPGTLMLSLQGAKVYQEQYHQLLLLAVISVVVSLPCYLFRKQILAFLNRFNKKEE